MQRKGYSGTMGIWWDPWTSLWECRNGGKVQMWPWLWCGLTPPMSSLPPTTSWSTPVLSSLTTGLRWTCPCGPACGPYGCCTTGALWQRHAFSSLLWPTTNTCLYAKVRVTLHTEDHKDSRTNLMIFDDSVFLIPKWENHQCKKSLIKKMYLKKKSSKKGRQKYTVWWFKLFSQSFIFLFFLIYIYIGIFCLYWDRTVESWQESIGWRERGPGSAKDLETGIELGSPWAQLRCISAH